MRFATVPSQAHPSASVLGLHCMAGGSLGVVSLAAFWLPADFTDKSHHQLKAFVFRALTRRLLLIVMLCLIFLVAQGTLLVFGRDADGF